MVGVAAVVVCVCVTEGLGRAYKEGCLALLHRLIVQFTYRSCQETCDALHYLLDVWTIYLQDLAQHYIDKL